MLLTREKKKLQQQKQTNKKNGPSNKKLANERKWSFPAFNVSKSPQNFVYFIFTTTTVEKEKKSDLFCFQCFLLPSVIFGYLNQPFHSNSQFFHQLLLIRTTSKG